MLSVMLTPHSHYDEDHAAMIIAELLQNSKEYTHATRVEAPHHEDASHTTHQRVEDLHPETTLRRVVFTLVGYPKGNFSYVCAQSWSTGPAEPGSKTAFRGYLKRQQKFY